MDGFWKEKSIEELAAEQGVSLEGQFERVLGSGKHLWKSDEELEKFLADIRERRRRGAEWWPRSSWTPTSFHTW